MNATVNYIADCVNDCEEEDYPYFDFGDECNDFNSNEEIKIRLIEILKSEYNFSDLKEIEIDYPTSSHICTIEINNNRFTVQYYICNRGYDYLNVIMD